MSDGSLIGWLDQPGFRPMTLNYTLGCTPRSAGCDLCYAPKWVARQAHLPGRDGIVAKGAGGRLGWTGKVVVLRERLEPLRRMRTPHMIFVTALGDLFDPQVSDDDLVALWRTMAGTPQHVYVILSKIAKRMHDKVTAMVQQFGVLSNVWLGVSCENQEQANIRIPWLLKTPARIRAVSCEPLLGPIDLRSWLAGSSALSWVIVGGESGPKDLARGMHPDWARALIGQAERARVAVFLKQWGSWGPAPWVVRIPDDVLVDPVRGEAAKAEAMKVGATHYLPVWAHHYGMRPTAIGYPPYGGERKDLEPGSPQAALRYFPGKSAGHLLDGRAVQQWPSVDGRIVEATRQEVASHG